LDAGIENQMAQLSWWPKANTWVQCRLNVGYLSADCEEWYQKHLENIRLGRGELSSTLKWQDLLKLKVGHTAKFISSLSKLGNNLLNGKYNYDYWRQ
jgi:hypothetical protein